MLATLLIFLSASVIAVKLLDFYMSDGQKKWLNDRVVRMWNWLDEAKRVPLLDLARTPRSKRLLLAIAICPIILQYASSIILQYGNIILQWISSPPAEKDLEITSTNPEFYLKPTMVLIALIIAIWLGRWVISTILSGKTAVQLFLRASVLFVFLLIVLLTFQELFLMIGVKRLQALLGIWPADIILFAILSPQLVVDMLEPFWAVSAGLVAFIYLGSLLLYIVELTIRRIAESPKGPVLAGSVVIGSVVSLIKAFGGG
jgi:hypothetical protein